MNILETIESVCPTCYLEGTIQKIKAELNEVNGKVWLQKTCVKHGFFRELYCSDVQFYLRWMKYKVTGDPVSTIVLSVFHESGLYQDHRSQTVLTNLVLTNRCTQKDSPSQACTESIDYVYEPPLGKLKELMLQTRNQKPVGSDALQITGGEPTLRDDFIDILHVAKEVGFAHVQIQTNGIKLAEDQEFCQQLKDAQVNTLYLRFQGVSKQSNPLLEYQIKALDHLKKTHMNVVLNPVVIGCCNLHEVGGIVRFARDHVDVARGVYFEPVSFCGKQSVINDSDWNNQRIDYLQIIEGIEHEFPGEISRDDFYPISFTFTIPKLFELMIQEPQVECAAHPFCGGSTFVFVEDGRLLPVTRFIDVEGYMEFFQEQAGKKGLLKKLRVASAFIKKFDTFVDYSKAPKGFDLKKMMKDAAFGGSAYAFREFSDKSFFIGMMWPMDPWNMNIDRLRRCVIHETTLEGIMPSCLYYGLGYGEKIQKKYSILSP